MKLLKKKNEPVSTFLIFALLPISGFAIDIYVPSFPAMAKGLNVDPAAIKLTLTLYTISYGLSQLLLGSLVDSYGRYRINLISLTIFILCSLGIIVTGNMPFILLMRVLQGVTIALVVMSRRAFLVDVYTGDKRARYMSMLSVVWSTAPILAPFAGGYLQQSFGWHANFVFLAVYGTIVLVLELIYGGETIKEKMKFEPRHIWQAYKTMLSASDFTLGMVFLGFSYAMVIVFSLSIPFIVEHGFHLSAVSTGYCALLSGVAIMTGGMLARKFTLKSIKSKLITGISFSMAAAVAMYLTSGFTNSLILIMLFVILIHFSQGFCYNIYFTYCVTRFPKFAGSAGGVTSGGSYVIVAFLSFIAPKIVNVQDQHTLALIYIPFIGVMAVTLCFILFALKKLKGASQQV